VFSKILKRGARRKFIGFSRDTSGAAAIEAAVCFPLILLVFFGCFQYAMFFMNASRINGQLDLAAREATLIETPTAENIKTLIGQAIGDEIKDSIKYDVAIVNRYGEEFADISVSYNYQISGPFLDRITLNKSYKNSVLLFNDDE